MAKITTILAIACSLSCQKRPDTHHRLNLLEVHIKIFDGQNILCSHPSVKKYASICYVELNNNCKAIYNVTSSEVKRVEMVCPDKDKEEE